MTNIEYFLYCANKGYLKILSWYYSTMTIMVGEENISHQ